MANTLGLQAAFRAQQSVGVKETSTNWSPYIKIYLNFVGWFKPAPWCAAFVAYKVHQAAGDLRRTARWPKTAGCDAIYAWAKKTGNLLDAPEPGCVFLVGSPRDYTHTGFVTAVGRNSVETVEGNSNNTGSREGTSVVRHERLIRNLTFVRIV
jgi:hypothetical protein